MTGQVREKAEQAEQLVKTPDPVLGKAAQATAQLRETAARAGQLAADKTPDPVREKAGQAATVARDNRTPLLAAAALVVFLLAAALQGAIFAVVKAAVDRAGAATTRRLTGTWPG
ncbi:DUF4235 domain-containing protein [Streptomyces sp. ISL-66]|uniref:DUF4235 domain-containing protein n=1 Tax=Streptomyces sp. ISL-66 TaxID=2819186 RepID=UPI0027E5B1E6|nr:DUF4235 domain-containing protein [Streptomyces sp. ISL-66]